MTSNVSNNDDAINLGPGERVMWRKPLSDLEEHVASARNKLYGGAWVAQ